MTLTTPSFLFLFLFVFSGSTLSKGEEVRLKNEAEFLKFAEDVNSGKSFAGTTVFLDAFIDLINSTKVFNPIGKDPSTPFIGTFDGQGYAINGFAVNSTTRYAGLFGYASGATIKNTIVSMRSVISVNRSEDDQPYDALYIGGVIGCCKRANEYCKIESSVNIANVNFTGKTNGNIYIGGIAGYIYSEYDSHIRNCANYGVLGVFGECNTANMGGIIGYYVANTNVLVVSNCLNLLPVVFRPRNVNAYYIGGIAGRSEYCSYDSCVNNGMIMGPQTGNVGSLCGYPAQSTFKNCYWNESAGDVAEGTKMEECASYNKSFVLSRVISAGNYTGDRLLTALNTAADYYSLYEYSHWGQSIGKHNVDFIINGRTKKFKPDNYLLLFPGLSSDGPLSFDGWYTDAACTIPVTDFVIDEDVQLYGRWGENTNVYTVTFDPRGGTLATREITGPINTGVILPRDATRDNCTFWRWENDYGDLQEWDYTIQPHNVTLHAVWGCEVIRTPSDLAGLAKVVNSGISYKGTTVTLANDIEFSEEEGVQHFELIGKDKSANFEGVFDGRGYAIKNLHIRVTTAKYGAIFGYSKGMRLRNVVVDATCSVVSTYGADVASDDESFFGAFIGCCDSMNGDCTIENSVNMAPVTFAGNTNADVFIGGFSGYIESSQMYVSSVVNCVNYGTISQAGRTANYGIVAGFLGGSIGVSITNCMNYGTLRHDGVSKTPCIGGIIEYNVQKTTIGNCVNLGEIVPADQENAINGAITGEILSNSSVKHCYWDSSSRHDPFGYADETAKVDGLVGFSTATFNLTDAVSIGAYSGRSLVDALNAYAEISTSKNLSRWVLNRGKHTVTFMIDNRTVPFLSVNSQVLLVPNITTGSETEFFWGWFVDPNYTRYFELGEITEDTTLYGFIDNTYVPPEEPGAGVDAAVVIACVVSAAIIALIVIGVVLWSRFGYKLKARREVHELMEPILVDIPGNSIEFLGLYPADYEKPTLKKALTNAGFREARAEEVVSRCYRHADQLLAEKKLPKGVTLDDAAALSLYTMETDGLSIKPYRMINDALMEGKVEELDRVKDMLYLVMCALRKMPVVYNKPLYRGITKDVLDEKKSENNPPSSASIDSLVVTANQGMFGRGGGTFEEDYLEGEEVMWSALSSTSPNITVTKAFLAKGTKSKKAEGTLFIIENGWGYNIQSCSMFPKEEEIVLEPERRFRVKTVIPGEGLTIIKMEMLRTPLVLTGVFGGSRGKGSKLGTSKRKPAAKQDKYEFEDSDRNDYAYDDDGNGSDWPQGR